MKLVTIKDQSKLELSGILVEFNTVDSHVQSVRFTDPKTGRAFVIDKGESYTKNVNVYEVQTHEDREQWKVTFTVGGRDAIQVFDDEDDARKFSDGFRSTEIVTTTEKVVTRVPLSGAVKAVDVNEDIPF